MTTVDARERVGWLAYWRLPRADRRAVRRIETTCRSAGDPRLDAIALSRLARAATVARLLGPLARPVLGPGLPPQDRLARLCSTMRHPSRTGVCAGRRAGRGTTPASPRTS
jgi:hypothetical protein